MKSPVWVRRDVVLAFHERLLAEHGGCAGIRDEGMLESALGRPENLFAYGRPTLFDLGASYRTSLDKTPLVFRATVQNVFNNNYWAGVTGFGALLEAAPRTILLSIAADF